MLTTHATRQLYAPLLLRNGSRAAFTRASSRLPRQIPAIAILIPHSRQIGTDTSTHGADGQPPPGFNLEKARQPLPKEKKSASQSDGGKEAKVNIPVEQPSVHAPTKAAEKQTLTELAGSKSAADKDAEKKKLAKKEEMKKLSLWGKIKHEAQHYWDGTKLLSTEVRISSKLALKMAAGYELTRREHRQLQRTVQDLGRLVPFSVFVIVPFAELLLPVALKLFPNMLPSTYEDAKSKEKKATSLRASRKEVSNFLRSTMRESGLPVSAANLQREEFTEFFRKLRATGESPGKSDIIKVCKLFKDDLTLDNLSRPQLVGMVRYMNLNTFGTDAMLRYQVRHRMRQIKRDDKAIAFEGVESLSVPELQTACAARGLRTHGMSPGRLRDDLHLWLDLRLKYGVPSTLLVLSNAFMYAQGKETEFDSLLDALQAVLSSIPEELFHEIELEVHTAEGAATNKQRLEVLREQQELIQEENEQAEEQKKGGSSAASVSDKENIDEKEDEVVEGKQTEVMAKGSEDGGESVESEKTAATGEFDDAKSQMEKIDSDDAAKKEGKKAEESKV
ncbi:LETM1 domain-containing protein ylh47 [Elasticomyces elasticus]|nr:LETM1 domain-containing protein ylh47 [Elasticomyces elasticus]KAK3655979.1 LETM1 domain-containing protein ylh47 [Elasticomyces elasticus]KAK4921479.1 LETM1 domain-containing protein ylh47 [Elasticomyces elasticus]KAK5760050.1 LETM1 domain-containing protein ylh47 [Elasticomyces elasticus]